jgi:hypothetical protein
MKAADTQDRKLKKRFETMMKFMLLIFLLALYRITL